MRSPKHKLTQSGKGWFKRIGSEVRWICSLRAAPTGAAADAVFERKFAELSNPAPAKPFLDVLDFSELFLARKRGDRDAGNLDGRTYDDYVVSMQAFSDAVGDALAVDDLTPADFARFRAAVARYGVHRRAKLIVNVRSLFRWGAAMRLCGPPDYGPDFSGPSRADFRKARAKREAETGHQLYTADDVGKLVAYSGTWNIRAMVLLALNGGFGNTDLAELTPAAIVDGWIRYRRGKTGIARAVPLWPETVAELARVRYPKAMGGRPAVGGTVFVSRQGKPLIVGTKDSVATAFAKLCEDVGVTNHGFYSLRRTFRTVADATGDTRAIARVMGHEVGDVADVYVQEVTPERLTRVVEHVRTALRIADAALAGRAADEAAARSRAAAASAWRADRRTGATPRPSGGTGGRRRR